jgi:hypothetical protein
MVPGLRRRWLQGDHSKGRIGGGVAEQPVGHDVVDVAVSFGRHFETKFSRNVVGLRVVQKVGREDMMEIGSIYDYEGWVKMDS